MDLNFDQDHQNTLDNTNKLLHDLERKLSTVSNTLSNHTHHSNTLSNQSNDSNASSIIINKNLSGLGKQNIKSSVLLYIKSSESNEFSTNDLFEERQNKFLTKFGKNYNSITQSPTSNSSKISSDSSSICSPPHIISQTQNNNDNDNNNDQIQYIDDVADISYTGSVINHLHERTNSTLQEDDETYVNNSSLHKDIDDDDNDDENDNLNGLLYDEFDDYADYEHDDHGIDDDDDDDDGILLPPSPPRSPPRELDPDKLYGLYDFSGPDPLHCSLLRNEPVFLINDQDNYWWLIKKLTKFERLLMSRDYQSQFDSDDFSDDEDGKIGFVPAECLETYGERLARLNCFKNEELEKSSRENLSTMASPQINESSKFDQYGLGINLSNAINYQNESQDSLSHSTSLKKSNSILKSNHNIISNNKSVTFEDLKDLDLNDGDKDDDDQDPTSPIRNHHNHDDAFHSNYFDIPHDEIQKSNHYSYSESSNSEEKRSEVLSDIYPGETPLVIDKNNRSNNNNKVEGSSPKEAIRISSDPEPEIESNIEYVPKVENNSESEPVIVDLEKSTSNINKTPTLYNGEYDKPSTPYPRNLDFKPNRALAHKNNNPSNLNPPLLNHQPSQNIETISIGSFSPDTPKSNNQNNNVNITTFDSKFNVIQTSSDSINSTNSHSHKAIPTTTVKIEENDSSQFRRSLILDRLNQVTFDIQEQLNLSHEDSSSRDMELRQQHSSSSYYSPEHLTFGANLKGSPENNNDHHHNHHDLLSKPNGDVDVDDLDVYDYDYDYADDDDDNTSHDNDDDDDDNTSNDIDHSDLKNSHHNHRLNDRSIIDNDAVTPLTSMNSLSNGISSSSSFANTSNSKPYYNPILTVIQENSTTSTIQTPIYSLSDNVNNHYNNDNDVDYDQYNKSAKITELSQSESENSVSIPVTKPVHEMFLPILGKFDDLASKLAELHDLL